MKRALICLAITLALILTTGVATASQNDQEPKPATTETKKHTSGQQTAAAEDNQFKSGAGDLKRGYGKGGKELGRGAAGFGKGMAQAEWDDAGSSLGRGAGSFGKNVGVGTGRGFKAFGLGIAKGAKSVAGALSGGSSAQDR